MLRMIFMLIKNPNNSWCIIFFLTDIIWSFQETRVIETGFSDFHKLVVTIIKSVFSKIIPRKQQHMEVMKTIQTIYYEMI